MRSRYIRFDDSLSLQSHLPNSFCDKKQVSREKNQCVTGNKGTLWIEAPPLKSQRIISPLDFWLGQDGNLWPELSSVSWSWWARADKYAPVVAGTQHRPRHVRDRGVCASINGRGRPCVVVRRQSDCPAGSIHILLCHFHLHRLGLRNFYTYSFSRN